MVERDSLSLLMRRRRSDERLALNKYLFDISKTCTCNYSIWIERLNYFYCTLCRKVVPRNKVGTNESEHHDIINTYDTLEDADLHSVACKMKVEGK